MVRETNWKPATTVLYTEEQIMGIFLRHDKNGDRQLSKAELGEAFHELGSKCPPVRALLAKHYADDNHDGFISIDNELSKLVNSQNSGQPEPDPKPRGFSLLVILVPKEIASLMTLSDGKRVMTTEELKQWLTKFDTGKDDRISKELCQAIRATGGCFARFKSRLGLRSADADCSSFIEEDELENLVDFAQKHLGVKIIHL